MAMSVEEVDAILGRATVRKQYSLETQDKHYLVRQYSLQTGVQRYWVRSYSLSACSGSYSPWRPCMPIPLESPITEIYAVIFNEDTKTLLAWGTINELTKNFRDPPSSSAARAFILDYIDPVGTNRFAQ